MKLHQILSPSFRTILMQLQQESFTLYHPASMVQRSSSICSQFCQALVSCRYLSFEQMLHAAYRYRLGASTKGGVIFWQIDHEGMPHDGKVMYYGPDCHRCKQQNPTWVSALLNQRNRQSKTEHESFHCLFGLHLLRSEQLALGFAAWIVQEVKSEALMTVAIVEAEKTAVILSEHYPQYIWLASGGLYELKADKFRPLRGRKVVLFPDTDPDGKAYRYWYQAAQEVMASPFWEGSPPIRVSTILEQHATPAQKAAKIDLIDFLF